MTCKSIYNITHDIACNGTGFEWTNCVPNMFVMHNGEILHPGDGSPIAFWEPDHKIGFANLPKFIPATVKEAVAVKRYLVMDGVQNPNPSEAWLELHTWQLLGQGINGETIIISTTETMNLYAAAALLIEAGAIWGGDLDSGGSVNTKCGDDIISVENRLVANFVAIDIGGTVPPDGGEMILRTNTAALFYRYVLEVVKGDDGTLPAGYDLTYTEEVITQNSKLYTVIREPLPGAVKPENVIESRYLDIVDNTVPPVDPPPATGNLPFILDAVGYKPFSGELEPDD